MIFAPTDAAVIEFAMKPHVDRCYGYMAMALGLDYWLVPQVTAFYTLAYEMDVEKAAAVVRLVNHIRTSRESTAQQSDRILHDDL